MRRAHLANEGCDESALRLGLRRAQVGLDTHAAHLVRVRVRVRVRVSLTLTLTVTAHRSPLTSHLSP